MKRDYPKEIQVLSTAPASIQNLHHSGGSDLHKVELRSRLWRTPPERREHRRVSSHIFVFQPIGFDPGTCGDQKRDYLALAAMVPSGRVRPAVDGPAQRRRVVFLIFEVDVRTWDQLFRQA